MKKFWGVCFLELSMPYLTSTRNLAWLKLVYTVYRKRLLEAQASSAQAVITHDVCFVSH